MKNEQDTPMAMVPLRDLGLQTKVQSLQHLFITLAASLHPLVLHTVDGQQTVDGKLSSAVKTSIEMALVHTCNRISAFMGDERNWVEDDNSRNILASLMSQALAEKEAEETKRSRKKKGPTSEQK
jgi:hypothetical protein